MEIIEKEVKADIVCNLCGFSQEACGAEIFNLCTMSNHSSIVDGELVLCVKSGSSWMWIGDFGWAEYV